MKKIIITIIVGLGSIPAFICLPAFVTGCISLYVIRFVNKEKEMNIVLKCIMIGGSVILFIYGMLLLPEWFSLLQGG